ncbi:MAG TPA: phosphatase PAP2 family protein [Acidobacteriaceae bacterium]|jgi:membrane-associated phospholipid phosphatase|nr:phosphatase PAP2 family protein [Acidobacteriaceae bacterium]
MQWSAGICFCSYLFLIAFSVSASAQIQPTLDLHPILQQSAPSLPDAPSPQAQSNNTVTLRNTPIHILKDQEKIWTSPIRIRTHDLKWLLPLAAATGVTIATDHHMMASIVTHDTSFNQANVNASNVLIGGFVAAPVALYGFGHFKDDAHASETGILGGEALVDGVVVEQGMKLIFWHERPSQDNAHGLFFQKSAGVDSSLPSSHSVLAWATAALIADEYPSRWTQLGVYSLATGVSVTRVLGQQHFPTDVLIGSAVGWLVGHYVYRAHHRHTFLAR